MDYNLDLQNDIKTKNNLIFKDSIKESSLHILFYNH